MPSKLHLSLLFLLRLAMDSNSAVTFQHVNRGATEFPSSIPDAVTDLLLGRNKLTRVTVPDLSRFSSLVRLALANNELVEVEDGALNSTTHPSLDRVIFNNNQLSSFPRLDGFDSLRIVNLAYNKLTTISFGKLDNLKWLHLDWNQLTAMPDFAVTMPSLRDIDVRNNNISFMPDGYFHKTPALQKLQLHFNTLTSIHFPNMTRLTFIHLNGNPLTSLPVFTSTLPSVLRLVVFDTSISSIPQGYFEQVPNLNHLRFGSHLLTDFTCHELPGLVKLVLSDSNFTRFPNLTACFRNLQKLSLLNCGTNIGPVREDLVFGSSPEPKVAINLHTLQFTGTHVGDLPDWLLHAVPNLTILSVATTQSTRLPDLSRNAQ